MSLGTIPNPIVLDMSLATIPNPIVLGQMGVGLQGRVIEM
jgi:hypothetical protein